MPLGNLTDVNITDVQTCDFLHHEDGLWVNRPLTGLIPVINVTTFGVPAFFTALMAMTTTAICPVGLSLTGGSCAQFPTIFPDVFLVSAGVPSPGLPTTWSCSWVWLGPTLAMPAAPPPGAIGVTVTAFCV